MLFQLGLLGRTAANDLSLILDLLPVGDRCNASKMEYTYVHIHGVTLALLLHAVAANQHYCDGLLFGRVQRRTRSEFRDDDSGIVAVEEAHAYVTSTVCSATMGNLYDSAGRISDESISALSSTGRDSVIGWFSSRPLGTQPSQPSMREAAISSTLQQWSDIRAAENNVKKQPMLFMLLGQRMDHHGATLSMGYRTFQYVKSRSGSMPMLRPIELHILNIARHLDRAAYTLPDDGLMLELCSLNPGRGQKSPQELAAAALQAEQQVTMLEEQQQGMMSQLQSLCRKINEQSETVSLLQQERLRLEAMLAQYNHQERWGST